MGEKLNDRELYEKFCLYGRAALEARNKCIGLLPEIYKRGIYLKRGYESIYEFAAKIAGLSQEQVNRVLNLEKRFADKQILHRALVEGEVSVNKLRKVVSIVTVENQQEILENVKALSTRAVETMVRDLRMESEVSKNGHVTRQKAMFQEARQVGGSELQIAEELCDELQIDQTVKQEFLAIQRKGIDLNILLKKFLENYRRELEIEKQAVAEEVPERTGRYVPVVVKNILKKEFGNNCAVPGCGRAFYEIHHLLPYALVKKHDPRLMVQLCREHHQITHIINRKILDFRNSNSMGTFP